MFYYTYVLQSLKDKKLYVGYTNNLKARYKLHSTGKVKSTKDRRPLKLVYFEACQNKKSATKREKSLKTNYGRTYLKQRLG